MEAIISLIVGSFVSWLITYLYYRESIKTSLSSKDVSQILLAHESLMQIANIRLENALESCIKKFGEKITVEVYDLKPSEEDLKSITQGSKKATNNGRIKKTKEIGPAYIYGQRKNYFYIDEDYDIVLSSCPVCNNLDTYKKILYQSTTGSRINKENFDGLYIIGCSNCKLQLLEFDIDSNDSFVFEKENSIISKKFQKNTLLKIRKQNMLTRGYNKDVHNLVIKTGI